MIRTTIAVLALSLALPAAAADETYAIDPVHSQPGFEAVHMGGFSRQHGSFGKMTGKIVLDRAAKKGTVDVLIDATSVKSFDSRLDTILKGENFFNVDRFPTLTFRSSNVTFDAERVVAVTGDFTMLGVTKPVTFKVDNFICGEHPFNKKPMCGAEATTAIRRSEWGMAYGIPKAVSDEVRITIPIEAYRE